MVSPERTCVRVSIVSDRPRPPLFGCAAHFWAALFKKDPAIYDPSAPDLAYGPLNPRTRGRHAPEERRSCAMIGVGAVRSLVRPEVSRPTRDHFARAHRRGSATRPCATSSPALCHDRPRSRPVSRATREPIASLESIAAHPWPPRASSSPALCLRAALLSRSTRGAALVSTDAHRWPRRVHAALGRRLCHDRPPSRWSLARRAARPRALGRRPCAMPLT
jgi:hypothetical protein